MSSCTTCCFLNGSGLNGRTQEKTDWLSLLKGLLTSHSVFERISFRQMKQYWRFLVKSAQCSQKKQWYFQTKEHNPHWNTEEAHLCYRVVLLISAQAALKMCRAQWNQKIIRSLSRETYCPVSESAVSVAGHACSNGIIAQNIIKQ